MADAIAEGGRATGGGGISAGSLPEVELKWSDFVWSMEKLRHKPYCKSMRERLVAMFVCTGPFSCLEQDKLQTSNHEWSILIY